MPAALPCWGTASGSSGSSTPARQSRRNAALREGVEALLRDRIIQSYNHYQDKGYCPIYAKESLKRMYDAYHSLGGNDVATKLKNELLEMPTELEE